MSYKEWIELESDPGLFTLLIYDFGVKDVEVEEVYDLSKPIEKDVYGFIFLFKWTEERKSRRKAAMVTEETNTYDKEIEDQIFFAEQIIPNSCASHALLSVLLNVPNLSLGYTLTKLRDSTIGFDAETKGYAIGNFRDINIAHNNHGRAELRLQQDRSKNISGSTRSMEAFHYVSYIPYNKQLYELDGLKPLPINHGPWFDDESWTDKARRVIQDRIQMATGGELSHDIRYNLMAVVPEQKKLFLHKMEILSHNKKVLIEVFKKLSHQESFVADLKSTSFFNADSEKHPFPRKNLKRSSNESHGPLSPSSSCSSTITGQESPTNQLSDSEDSSAETNRIKAIMRGQMSGPVYVYSETSEKKLKLDIDTIKSETKDVKNCEDSDKTPGCVDEKNIENINTEDKEKKQNENEGESTTCEGELKTETCNNDEPSKTTDSEQYIKSEPSENKTETLKDNNTQLETTQIKQEVDSSSSEIISSDNQTLEDKNLDLQNNSDSQSSNDRQVCDSNVDDENNKRCIESNLSAHKVGLGVEIIADDVDVTSLLDQNKLEKLSFEKIIKYADKIKLKDLQHCMQEIDEIYKSCETSYKEELEKIEKYKIDDARRRHNYDPFIATFLTMLAEQGLIGELLEEQNSVMKRVSSSSSLKNNNNNNSNHSNSNGSSNGIILSNNFKKDIVNKTNGKKKKIVKKMNKKKKKKT